MNKLRLILETCLLTLSLLPRAKQRSNDLVVKNPDDEVKDLAFKGYLKEREYLIKAGDESLRQLDQLIFYTSSAAIGLSITQIGNASSYGELASLAMASLLFILTLIATYLALKYSAASFEANRADADKAETVPYGKSKETEKLEKRIATFEKVQNVCFVSGLLFLLLFMGFRIAIAAIPHYFIITQLPPKTNTIERAETKMTEKKNEIKENSQQKKSNIQEHAVKPKPPAPIKPSEPKPTTSPKKNN